MTRTAPEDVLLDHQWVGSAYQCLCQVREEPVGGLNADDTIDEADWLAHLLGLLTGAGWSLEHGYRTPDDPRVRLASSAADATRMGTAVPVARLVTAWSPGPATVTVRAGDLTGQHIGMLATLPGWLDPTAGTWVDTAAPITQVLHRKDGMVKVRRHPDGHVDHTLNPDTLLELTAP